jgi:hypothetical protein
LFARTVSSRLETSVGLDAHPVSADAGSIPAASTSQAVRERRRVVVRMTTVYRLPMKDLSEPDVHFARCWGTEHCVIS